MSNAAYYDGLSIEAIAKEDRQAVIGFLDKFYNRDEPLNSEFVSMGDVRALAKSAAFTNSLLDNGLIACKAVSTDGRLIGVISSGVICKFDKREVDAEDDTKFKLAMILLKKVEEEADVFGQYPNVCRALNVDMFSVDDKYRGKGVGKALIDKTRELALKNQCSIIIGVCNSYFSAKAAESLGFQCVYKLPYKDYLNDKGQQIFNPPPPHTHVEVYVLPLDNGPTVSNGLDYS